MQPEEQNSNPYEFIMNPQKPPKHRFGFKDSFLMKMAFIGVGVVGLLVVVGVIISLAFRGSQVDINGLVGLAQTQQELIRISGQGSRSSQPDVRNLAITVKLSVDTNKLQLVDYLRENDRKLTTKELNLKHNNTTDTRLTNAVQTSTFDSVFVQIMHDSLVIYNTEVEEASSRAVGTIEKQILAKTAAAAALLLKQVPPIESVQPGGT